jgi:hypothetical protein
MRSPFDILQQESRITRLYEEEREAMRESLMAYMKQKPIPENKAASKKQNHILSQYITGRTLLVLVILIVILAGAGVSYAAERAIPGDMLYFVKKDFNEKAQHFLVFSDSSKIDLEVSLASQRLMEAEKLNAHRRLSNSAKNNLSTEFKHHISVASDTIKKMVKENKIEDALKANLNLAAAISAHQSAARLILGPEALATSSLP